ncbi:DNA adenine methylase [Caudoviricetes sp.]|nr:DNA adenine methylase [Caudoviricetes sp.]
MTFTGAFPWCGGKSKLASKIIPYFPEHKCYVEPFFGSGAMFFARKERAKVECVNDLNGDIANFFRVIREQADEFCERLPLYPHSRDDFNYLKGLDVENLSPLDRALRFYIIVTGSFAANMRSFAIHGHTTGHQTLNGKIKNVQRISKELDKVSIENVCFKRILKTYDAEQTFFYLDPPYYETSNSQYKTPLFKEYDFIADFMRSQKGKTALSINDHSFIRELFKDFHIVEFPIKYSCKKGEATPRTELLVMNYG